MPVALCGDMKKAFLQVHVREKDRDVLRFHWIKNQDQNQIVTYRFTRSIWGLNQSPFILGGTVEEHLTLYENIHPEVVSEIRNSLYVDDMISGGFNETEVRTLKQLAIKIFAEAKFTLHKWHSNISSLESDINCDNEQSQTYAKSQLGVKQNETKILGLVWDKIADTISVAFPIEKCEETKADIAW